MVMESDSYMSSVTSLGGKRIFIWFQMFSWLWYILLITSMNIHNHLSILAKNARYKMLVSRWYELGSFMMAMGLALVVTFVVKTASWRYPIRWYIMESHGISPMKIYWLIDYIWELLAMGYCLIVSWLVVRKLRVPLNRMRADKRATIQLLSRGPSSRAVSADNSTSFLKMPTNSSVSNIQASEEGLDGILAHALPSAFSNPNSTLANTICAKRERRRSPTASYIQFVSNSANSSSQTLVGGDVQPKSKCDLSFNIGNFGSHSFSNTPSPRFYSPTAMRYESGSGNTRLQPRYLRFGSAIHVSETCIKHTKRAILRILILPLIPIITHLPTIACTSLTAAKQKHSHSIATMARGFTVIRGILNLMVFLLNPCVNEVFVLSSKEIVAIIGEFFCGSEKDSDLPRYTKSFLHSLPTPPGLLSKYFSRQSSAFSMMSMRKNVRGGGGDVAVPFEVNVNYFQENRDTMFSTHSEPQQPSSSNNSNNNNNNYTGSDSRSVFGSTSSPLSSLPPFFFQSRLNGNPGLSLDEGLLSHMSTKLHKSQTLE
ncbi:hypothetical protein H4219_002146 [Mycoemilia scoparia]|uniref:Uncharacterized protein n=1 Tax=Mycoemilia scoparia TaxID=417184 RepID=A0A9W8A4V6_9FUNG|nr:hypothetical protein H4219_002146 [Mycoemilia scoparia]